MTTAKAEATQILVAREAVRGTAPSTGWRQLQPNPGGIQGWQPEFVDVERDPLSTLATREKGDHVGLNASPVLVHDLNKDLVDEFAEGWLRSAAKVPGNKGVAVYYPTAVVDGGAAEDSYTVDANGDLTAGLLIYARGFANAANNGLKVLSGASTATAIKVATGTLVAETVAPANSATVEVCGVQGASGDITLDASGDLTSTALNFTTLGLIAGVSRIKLGGATAATQFATAAYNGWAVVKAISATKLTLTARSWTVGAADTGAGKTIQVFIGRCYRNVAIDHADYLEPSWHGEKEDQGVGAGDAAVYTYAEGMSINTVAIAMPVQAKIEVTANFIGTDITDPVLAAARVAGPASAYNPLSTELHDTSNDLLSCKIVNASDDSTLVAEVNSCNIQIAHNVQPRNQLATFGAAGMIFGKIEPSATMEVYYERSSVPTAIRNNTTCRFEAITRNDQGAIAFDMPAVTLRGGAMTYAANSPVMLSLSLPAHRDPTTNIVACLNVFPYVYVA